ncbi:peptidoglycan DD-metalloendopeptidase family protein [Candidatus Microgenomates bacterium]|nr:peptidoglycan DD-metalloendopeptidase family protein [Candidatus Microgenomates bacterium]
MEKAKIFLGIALMVLVLFSSSGGVLAGELDDQIIAKKKQADQVNQQIKNLQNSLAQKQKEIKSLGDQLNVIDSRIELIQLQLQANQRDIEQTSADIARTENEIKDKEEEIARQKETMERVIRKIYMDKGVNAVSIIVESQSFSELVEKTEYLARIRAKLKDTVDRLKVLKAELETKKEQLDEKMKGLETLRHDNQLEESALEDQKYTKAKIVEMTRGQESEFKSRLSAAQAEEAAANREIVRLVQEQARRNRASGVEGRPGRDQVVNTGGFGYPLAGPNRISITGGDFMDASYGLGFPHTGIDLAASQGTTIYAAGSGAVIVAHDSGNAGLSYIAIDHGNGLITKYLHVSAIFVQAGDIVNIGDPIGQSGGSPGTRGAGIFTTGAHLHFEINDYQGRAVNPHNYLSFLPPLF